MTRTLEPVWTVDDAVPADLAIRWAAADSEEVLFRDFARTMISAGACVLVIFGLLAALVGVGDPVVLLLGAALGALALVVGSMSRRRARRRPDAFSAGEIDLLLEYRREVTFNDWDVLVGVLVPREVAAARQAAELGDGLAALPDWSADHLATHRLRLNPVLEAQQIRLAARELYDLRCALEAGSPRFEGRLPPELQSARADWNLHLSAAWSALSERLTAFEQYSQEVLELARALENTRAAECLNASLIEHAPALAVTAAGNEMAAAHLRALSSELSFLHPPTVHLPDPERELRRRGGQDPRPGDSVQHP